MLKFILDSDQVHDHDLILNLFLESNFRGHKSGAMTDAALLSGILKLRELLISIILSKNTGNC